jgi:hypothetical protein
MVRQIFRKEALERLSSPEQLDQLMQVTGPRGWIALAAVGLLLLAVLAWGLFGTIPVTVEGQGFLVRAGGIKTVAAPRTGVVASVPVHPGEEVGQGLELARLAPTEPDGADAVALNSPCAARVLDVAFRAGDTVPEGAVLITLEPRDAPLQAVLYVPPSDGYQVEPGMSAQVWPAPVRRGESGPLRGQVRSASKFPVGQAEMRRRVPNEDLVKGLTGSGPSLEIVVDLTAEGGTLAGSGGPALRLYSGTPCEGQITVRRRRPIDVVFPTFGDLPGS